MPSSLIKFMNRHDGNGRGSLHWHRAEQDGYPFRGPVSPTMTEQEFEERLTKVADANVREFDLSDEEQTRVYIDVLDKIHNGWANCFYIERYRDKDDKRRVYVEWVEYYMEDGTRSPAIQPMSGMTSNELPPPPAPFGSPGAPFAGPDQNG